ncbi:phage protein NinX family protein [Salinisphaera sp. T31B1]|uniref:phage protein NinX family protein n=1 Tax=Salinisphaera sp. T31B1 TaxID=727963 RepID=UPI00333F4A0F
MIKMEVNELDGSALDWAVATAVGDDLDIEHDDQSRVWLRSTLESSDGVHELFTPSSNHAQAGPLIDESGIATRRHSSGTWYAMLSDDLGDGVLVRWDKHTVRGGQKYGPHSYQVRKRQQRFTGSTRLIASMRTLVASRMGPVVQVPSTLIAAPTADSTVSA